ncbi:MAG: leucine-rich repeat protein [Ruminococcus sp.]|nr:leucine-rich repeat protein [Ruminococcus sp.]MBQ6336814.1 leucine-rich repeat protein [Ruminococcus sp.]
MKRTLSLILSLLMVLSLFSGLSVGAGARVSDLAGTGAEAEIAEIAASGDSSGTCGTCTYYFTAKTGTLTFSAPNGEGIISLQEDNNDTFRGLKKYTKKLIIENGVKRIEDSAFYEFDCMVELSLPSSLEHIGTDAFEKCGSLQELVIPGSVKSWGNNAFGDCDSLVKVTVTPGASLGNLCFYGCNNLSIVSLPDGMTEIPGGAFYGATKLSEITIPATVEEIGGSAFYGCHALETVTFLKSSSTGKPSIKSIESYAFKHCEKLKDLDFSETQLENVGEAAFENCDSMLTFSFPETIQTIDTHAVGYYSEFIENLGTRDRKVENFIIKGYETTAAQTYAIKNGIAFYAYLLNAGCTITEPTAGQKPDSNPVPLDSSKYSVSLVSWYLKSGNTTVPFPVSSTFEAEKTYIVRVRFNENGGAFTNHTGFTINGKTAKKIDNNVYEIVFQPTHAPISSVAVTDVIAPMPGAFANTCCTIPSDCGYRTRYNYYDGVTWYTEEGDILSHGVDKFVGGKKYTAQIALTALDGYVFSESATGTINGTNARVRVDNQRKNLYVNLTFTCPKVITAADCAVTDPVAGEKPNDTAVSGDSGKYSAEIINWFKGSGDRAVQMASRESFEAGNTYSVRVRYTAQDGYVFDENTVYTVNGQSTTYLGRGVYETSFTVINPNQPKPLASVSCTVTKPIAGQKPDNTAVPADSTKYFATVGSWIYGTGRTARTMSDDEEFIEGKSYQVQVKFTANRGYYLTDDTFCIINGKAATKVTIRGEDYYVVTFTAEAATTAISEFSVTNIMEPVAGQSPYYYAAVPAGKGYLVDEDFTDGTWVNGVLWHNDTDNKDMTENDTFEADKQYTVTVLLDSAAGYSFASNVSGTLNGENAEVISYGNSSIGVYRTFTCQTIAILGDVDGDSAVTIIDATYIQRHLASIPIPFVLDEAIADTDEDGLVSIMDVTYIQRWLAHLKSNDHIGQPM